MKCRDSKICYISCQFRPRFEVFCIFPIPKYFWMHAKHIVYQAWAEAGRICGIWLFNSIIRFKQNRKFNLLAQRLGKTLRSRS
jgi:hypothetical protein